MGTEGRSGIGQIVVESKACVESRGMSRNTKPGSKPLLNLIILRSGVGCFVCLFCELLISSKSLKFNRYRRGRHKMRSNACLP